MTAKRPADRSLADRTLVGRASAALLSPDHLVERAAGELRRGAPVLIRAQKRNESVVAVAAETVSDATLAGLVKLCGTPFSILTHARAATLKIRLYTPDVVSIPHDASVTATDLRALADPSMDLDNPLKGPFNASRLGPSDAVKTSVQLAKLAGLLTGDGGVQSRRAHSEDAGQRPCACRSPRRGNPWLRRKSRDEFAIAHARSCSTGRRGRRRTRGVPSEGWRSGTLCRHHRGQARRRPRAAGTRAHAHAFGVFDRRSARLAQMRLRRSVARRDRGDRRSRRRRSALSCAGRARHRADEQAPRLRATG